MEELRTQRTENAKMRVRLVGKYDKIRNRRLFVIYNDVFSFYYIVIKVQNMFDKEKYPKALRFSIMIEGLFCRTTDE